MSRVTKSQVTKNQTHLHNNFHGDIKRKDAARDAASVSMILYVTTLY